MTQTTALHVAGIDGLIEPPILDFLYHDADRHAYIVNFVPEDAVSAAEIEVAEIPDAGSEALRIETQLRKLADLFHSTQSVARITHGGGGDFVIQFEGGESRKLCGAEDPPPTLIKPYGILQDIAMTAQIAYIILHRI